MAPDMNSDVIRACLDVLDAETDDLGCGESAARG
jgi:hypothetical protein